jgi:hypothetical protein
MSCREFVLPLEWKSLAIPTVVTYSDDWSAVQLARGAALNVGFDSHRGYFTIENGGADRESQNEIRTDVWDSIPVRAATIKPLSRPNFMTVS